MLQWSDSLSSGWSDAAAQWSDDRDATASVSTIALTGEVKPFFSGVSVTFAAPLLTAGIGFMEPTLGIVTSVPVATIEASLDQKIFALNITTVVRPASISLSAYAPPATADKIEIFYQPEPIPMFGIIKTPQVISNVTLAMSTIAVTGAMQTPVVGVVVNAAVPKITASLGLPLWDLSVTSVVPVDKPSASLALQAASYRLDSAYAVPLFALSTDLKSSVASGGGLFEAGAFAPALTMHDAGVVSSGDFVVPHFPLTTVMHQAQGRGHYTVVIPALLEVIGEVQPAQGRGNADLTADGPFSVDVTFHDFAALAWDSAVPVDTVAATAALQAPEYRCHMDVVAEALAFVLAQLEPEYVGTRWFEALVFEADVTNTFSFVSKVDMVTKYEDALDG